MWNWIKNLFKPKKHEIKKEDPKQALSKLTKGDLKKLYAQGKITADFKNYIK